MAMEDISRYPETRKNKVAANFVYELLLISKDCYFIPREDGCLNLNRTVNLLATGLSKILVKQ